MLCKQKKIVISYFLKQICSNLCICLLLFFSQCNAYNITKCKYNTNNYSLEWAFEPLTEHVVFVLSVLTPSTNQTLLSGVGFSKQNSVSLFCFYNILNSFFLEFND